VTSPVLYLMAPMTLYWTPVLAEARRFGFASLAGCPVDVECAEGMFPDTRSWAAAWPVLRHRYAFGVFLDAGGWVSRGVWAEACDLAGNLGRPVWWFNSGRPVRRFGFGPADNAAWAGRYRKVYALEGVAGDAEREPRTVAGN
jgi:hypothetical protein